MTTGSLPRLPWSTGGARLHLPRDLHAAYIVGRMGAAASADVWPVLWGSHGAGKFGFARLQRLGLVRMFPRRSASELGWFGLAPQAASWVADEMGCPEAELRVVHGVSRMNLAALRQRNRLWVSLVLASRASQGAARLSLIRTEWELRRAREAQARLVPDVQVVLEAMTPAGPRDHAWFVELDAGTERLGVWAKKADAYLTARRGGAFYGEGAWRVLALVPSARRARSVAGTVAKQGAGDLVWLALQAELEEGLALEPRLWRADELAAAPEEARRWSLLGVSSPGRDPEPRPRSAADRGSPAVSREVPR